MSETKHTPGPWHWEANPKAREIALESPKHGVVMDFVRWGMTNASPRFRSADGRIMEHAMKSFEIEPGREHHAEWHALVDHPDARLMKASPDLLEAAKLVDDLPSLVGLPTAFYAAFNAIRAAIAEAEPPDA